MNHQITISLFSLSAAALLLAGCGKQESETTGGTGKSSAVTPLPAGVFLTAAPEKITPISELKETAAEGDEVVVRTVVGGRKTPRVAGRAIWTVVDAGFPNACIRTGHACAKPWDYCCASPDDLAPHLATIQVVDADNRPLAVDLSQSEHIKPMATLVVRATVAARPNPQTLILNATGIYAE